MGGEVSAPINEDATPVAIDPSVITQYFNCSFPVNLSAEVFALKDELKRVRRYFHCNPELSYKEENTSKVLAKYLTKLGLEVAQIGKTGIVGLLRGNHPGKCVLFKAEMDAVPLQETTTLSYKSQIKNTMHACGHDCHMSILLGVAGILSRLQSHLHGSVKFCFQSGEDGVGGTKFMIKEGVLEHPHVDEVYALHLVSYEKFGKVSIQPGPVMAGNVDFRVKIKGKGGYASNAQGTKDALIAAAHLVVQLQTIVSRNVGSEQSSVVSVGKLHSGYRTNLVSDFADVEGTMRWLSQDIYHLVKKRIEDICQGVHVMFDVEVNLEWVNQIEAVSNDYEECVKKVTVAASQVLPQGLSNFRMVMESEDFSLYLKERPGCFFYVGGGVDEAVIYPHHTSNFQIDERSLPVSCQILCSLALSLLLEPNESAEVYRVVGAHEQVNQDEVPKEQDEVKSEEVHADPEAQQTDPPQTQ